MSPNPHQRPLETSTSTGSCALFHCRLRKALSPGLTPGVRRESRQPDARAAIARSTAQQIANPAALTLITALHFGQNFSPPGPSAASGGHCEPITADSNTAESNMELYRYPGPLRHDLGAASPRRSRIASHRLVFGVHGRLRTIRVRECLSEKLRSLYRRGSARAQRAGAGSARLAMQCKPLTALGIQGVRRLGPNRLCASIG